MLRGALQFGAFVLTLIVGSRTFAHNGPPVAYAVLSHDAAGPRAVSFNSGVALRRSAQRYQFVCPGAWLDQFPSPVAALADGSIAVGSTHGLMLLDENGAVRAHPDPAAVGRSNELARSARGVFSLRPAADGSGGSEVLAVDSQSVRVLWKDATSWASLAAAADMLVLVRANNRLIEMVTISALDGTEIDRQSATVDAPVDYVFARVNAGASYALVVYRNGTMVLGSLSMKTFIKLADAGLSIAGPLSIENATLLAIDGQLTQLIAGIAMPVADAHNVVGLGEHDGLTYACEREGISLVRDQALAEPLFRFSWLQPPALELVPEGEQRMLCNMQWQDFLLDMHLAMLDTLDASTATTADAVSAQPAAAGAAAVSVVAAQPTQTTQSRGCTTLPGAHTSSAAAITLFGLGVILTVVRRRRTQQC